MSRALALLALLAIGCVSYEDGQRERGALNCERLDVCGDLDGLGYADVDACKATAADQQIAKDDCPAYDASAMSACLDAYRDAIDAQDCEVDLDAACADVCG